MEFIGWFCFIIILCYSGYPRRVKHNEKRIKNLEKKQNGGNEMSNLVAELKGKNCLITFDASFDAFFDNKVNCKIVDTDNEWIKITYEEKKKKKDDLEKTKVKIVRIENIESIELCD